MSPLSEIVSAFEYIKLHVLDLVGPFAPVVTAVGQILTAMMAIFLFAAGKGFWAPVIPGLKNFAVRVSGLIAGVGLVGLYLLSNRADSNFLLLAAFLIGVAFLGALGYIVTRQMLCFECEGDRSLYIRGLRLQPPARRVLNGETNGLPSEYDLRGAAPPPSDTAYFCRTNKELEFIWTRGSLAVSQAILFVSYFVFIVPLTLGIASAAYALTESQVKIVDMAGETRIEVPADILFEFNDFRLRPAAIGSLKNLADIMRQRKAASALIEGHTDSIGTVDHNMRLSLQRAEAVRTWLMTEGGLSGAKLTVKAFGAASPLAPNTNVDGSDNPDGRAKNRRVTVVLQK